MNTNPWNSHLDQIKDSVIDALVIYKGDLVNGERVNFGICAQINSNTKPNSNEELAIKMKPLEVEVEKWIEAFQKIEKFEHPENLKLECTFADDSQKAFTIIDYNKYFIRSHFACCYQTEANNEQEVKLYEHSSLMLSHSRDYIFVGFTSYRDPTSAQEHIKIKENKGNTNISELESVNKKVVKGPAKAFMAIDKIARFVRDCELFNQMEQYE